MNVETPASRTSDPAASYDAEQHINRSGVRARHQKMTASAVELYPGLTSLEIAQKTSICRYLLARRLPADARETPRRDLLSAPPEARAALLRQRPGR